MRPKYNRNDNDLKIGEEGVSQSEKSMGDTFDFINELYDVGVFSSSLEGLVIIFLYFLTILIGLGCLYALFGLVATLIGLDHSIPVIPLLLAFFGWIVALWLFRNWWESRRNNRIHKFIKNLSKNPIKHVENKVLRAEGKCEKCNYKFELGSLKYEDNKYFFQCLNPSECSKKNKLTLVLHNIKREKVKEHIISLREKSKNSKI